MYYGKDELCLNGDSAYAYRIQLAKPRRQRFHSDGRVHLPLWPVGCACRIHLIYHLNLNLPNSQNHLKWKRYLWAARLDIGGAMVANV